MGRRKRTTVAALAAVLLLVATNGCQPGSRDPGFGNDGSVLHDRATWSSTAPTPDGGLVVSSHQASRLWRVAPDGAIDPEWSDALPASCASSRGELARDSGGGYVLTCVDGLGDPVMADLVRVTRSGLLDARFGVGGVASFPRDTGPSAFVPLRSGGYLGARGYLRTDGLAGVEVSVLDRRGAVVATTHFSADPPRSGTIFGGPVLAPAREGAVVMVGSGEAGSVFRLDRHGQVTQRIDGPWPGAGGAPFQGLRSARELPGGRLVVFGMADSAPPGPRPPQFPGWFADVYSRHGEHQYSIDLRSPTAGGVGAITPDEATASADGRWLWVTGPVDQRGCDWNGACEVIVRYDLATGRLDTTFGHDGVVLVTPDIEGITALVPRWGEDQMYVAGNTPTATGFGTRIIRLWDTTRSGAGSAPAATEADG